MRTFPPLALALSLLAATLLHAQTSRPAPPRPPYIPQDYNDQRHMMDQLGIRALRPGPSGKTTFSEAASNPFPASLPDLLTCDDGSKVTSPDQWPKRRAQIAELFEREVYGRIPPNVPAITWELTATTEGENGGIPTLTKSLVGHVDNSAFPQISVNIQATFTIPAHAPGPFPILIEFGPPPRPASTTPATSPATEPARPRPPAGPPAWTALALRKGWGYGFLTPNSIQPDAGGNALRQGIIGLTNKGEPRTPDQWGALRAWAWGASRLLDYFEQHPDARADPHKFVIEGVSRFGKASLVAEAFDQRIAAGFIASSGAGGSKLLRHQFGEQTENLAGSLYYWFAGNFMKYAAADATFGPKTTADLPVDAHMLLALCAPRPCFLSSGTVAGGDPDWIDAHGSYMAGILASPAYRLLGKHGLNTPDNYLDVPMPPVGGLLGGELAWRQHEGGHTSLPNFPAFFDWIQPYLPATPAP